MFFAALEEIVIAARGGDWGFAALAELLGNDWIARVIVNTVGSF